MLRWIYGRFSFWDLACYGCGGRNAWNTSLRGRRTNSYIAVASCSRCGATQFLKKYRPGGNLSKSNAEWEYDVLRYLAGGAGSKPSILLPRVYHFAPTTCSLSMEYIPGVTLDERMRNAEDRKGFDDCLRASAAWLRGLHSMPPKHDNAGNGYNSILRQLELDCASLSGRNVMVAHVLTYMRSSLEEISSLPVKRVLLHGDFKASNLIWAPKGIYGIDISMRFKNPWVMDAAQFITNILLNWRNIPSMAGSRNIVHVLDVFLEGYGHTNRSTRKVVVWWLLCFLLSRWQSDARDWRLSAFLTRPYAAILTEVMALCDKNSLPGWDNEY